MMRMVPPVKVKVWGDVALFTRPEAKVERVSYPIITPSSARGVLESIFWKPEFKYIVRTIQVLKPVQYYSILRNEVASIVPSNIQTSKRPFLADEDRQQRHSLMLRDVEYIIEADIVLMPHATENVAKYRDIFRRRVSKGQCFQRPYLGTRECSAHFAEPTQEEQPIAHSEDLGMVLFDIKYPHDPNMKNATAVPYFFDAGLNNGVLTVPHHLYREVYGEDVYEATR